MPNIASVLKAEILRLAEKAVRSAVNPLKSEKVALKKAVRDLRKRVIRLEKEQALLVTEQQRHRKLVVGALPAEKLTIRVTAKGMRSLRRKLGLTQVEFARLVGISGQNVYQWEHKEGAIRVRDATKKAIFAVRDMGAREAKRRLQDMAASAARVQKRGKRRKK
jgi:DNA-binding transcriptional regulator YiaG